METTIQVESVEVCKGWKKLLFRYELNIILTLQEMKAILMLFVQYIDQRLSKVFIFAIIITNLKSAEQLDRSDIDSDG